MISEFNFHGRFDDKKNIITEAEFQYALFFIFQCGLKAGRLKQSEDESIDYYLEMSDILIKNIELNKHKKKTSAIK